MLVLDTDYLFQTFIAKNSEQYSGILFTNANENGVTQNSQNNNNPTISVNEY